MSKKTLISHDGTTDSIAGWARRAGLNPVTLGKRLRDGVPFTKAIATRSLRLKRSGRHYKVIAIGRQKVRREHVLIAEQALGRPLPDGAVVHHIDGDINNNANNNLIILQSHADHALIHANERALKEGGNPNVRKCAFCHEYDHPTNMKNRPSGGFHHKSCYNTYMRNHKLRAKVTENQ